MKLNVSQTDNTKENTANEKCFNKISLWNSKSKLLLKIFRISCHVTINFLI